MKFILGKKLEMTQRFRGDGRVVPVTLVQAGPCVITQVKKMKKDGYNAIQFGFGKKNKINKPKSGHLKNLGNLRFLREMRLPAGEEKVLESAEVGKQASAAIFAPGDIVKVTGVSKGKGFQGVVRRHGFHGSPASHGHKDQLRMPGSIGAGGVQRVPKGRRMGGHMGNEQSTVRNLEIVDVDKENNILAIKGAVPGARNSLVIIEGDGEMVFEKAATELVKTEQDPAQQESNPSATLGATKQESKADVEILAAQQGGQNVGFEKQNEQVSTGEQSTN